MPPQQLPAPARRLLEIAKLRNRLRQSIRRGSLVCRDYSDPQLSYPYLALRLSDQLSDYELVHIDEMDRNLSRVLFKSRLRGRSVKYSSEVLVNPSSAVIIVPGADPWRAQAQSLLVLDRWHRNISRSRFVNLLSKVLINNPTSWSRSVKRSSAELVDPLFGLVCVQSLSVNPQFIAFNWSFRSRSVEVTSTALVNQPSTVDSVCVGRSPAITIQNSTLLEELQLVKKSKKNKPAGGSVARELDERRRSPFDVIPKLMNGAELYRDLERHQQSRRECAAVIETCAEYAQIISTGNQYIFSVQSKYSPAESSDCKIFAKLFEKFLDNLMDMVVLLPVSKTGKAKAKKGDDVNVKVKEKERTILISSGLLFCFTALLNMIGIKKVPGGTMRDSFLVNCVAFKKTFSCAGFEQHPKKFVNPKILLLNIELELKSEKGKAELRLSDPSQYQSIVDAEWNIIYDKLYKCVKSAAKVVLSRLAIGDMAKYCDGILSTASSVWFLDTPMMECGGTKQSER